VVLPVQQFGINDNLNPEKAPARVAGEMLQG